MKNIFAALLIFLVQHLYSGNAFAQGPYIDSVKILPDFQTKGDTVRVFLHVHTTAPGILLYLQHQVINNTIDIKGCYSITSGLLRNELYDDTITVGTLQPGNYQVNFTAYQSFSKGDCKYTDSTKIAVPFSVTPPESISAQERDVVKIYPNPAKDLLHVDITKSHQVKGITIQNIHGKTVQSFNYINNNVLDISSLPVGMYMLYINTNKGRYLHKFLKE